MRTALIFVGFGSDIGYDDSVFFKSGVEISSKSTVFNMDSLRSVSKAAFESSDGVVFVYKKEAWTHLQKVLLMEFERSSVYRQKDEPYVIAKGFKELIDGVFFDEVYGKPFLMMPFDLKENLDFSPIFRHFVSEKRIVKLFEPENIENLNPVYKDEVEAVFLCGLKDVKQFECLKGFYTSKGESAELALFNSLKTKKKVKIATAESCTAGLVSSRIANIPGVSEFLEGGAITYSNRLKITALKVPPAVLNSVGAVSEETAKLMAVGAIKMTNSDYAVSVTGIAGPTGATLEKPVGLVYFSVASKRGRVEVRKKVFSGNRSVVRDKSARYATLFLREFILKS